MSQKTLIKLSVDKSTTPKYNNFERFEGTKSQQINQLHPPEQLYKEHFMVYMDGCEFGRGKGGRAMLPSTREASGPPEQQEPVDLSVRPKARRRLLHHNHGEYCAITQSLSYTLFGCRPLWPFAR
ncbi:uncharacterized protein LOC143923023 [Arctopsyche grandis]|uniref:uncharacterized protein LOC143923023 n=1 Tax=Arctopsyche grandis TaxID=121162 RepID=UPI00406D719C